MKRYIPVVGRLFARVMRDERGGEVVEYGMTLGIIAATGFAVAGSVGDEILELWRALDTALSRI
jgi:Flp pilus assembly pilin Flp